MMKDFEKNSKSDKGVQWESNLGLSNCSPVDNTLCHRMPSTVLPMLVCVMLTASKNPARNGGRGYVEGIFRLRLHCAQCTQVYLEGIYMTLLTPFWVDFYN